MRAKSFLPSKIHLPLQHARNTNSCAHCRGEVRKFEIRNSKLSMEYKGPEIHQLYMFLSKLHVRSPKRSCITELAKHTQTHSSVWVDFKQLHIFRKIISIWKIELYHYIY